MFFNDRNEAGQRLADRLEHLEGSNVIVLGIPRGGVAVAFPIAQKLQAPLDVYLSRKLGVPGQEELAFGAVCQGQEPVLDPHVIRSTHVSPDDIERITRGAREALDRAAQTFRGDLPPLQLEHRSAILVDDGIATGASMLAAVRGLRAARPARIVVAVPVAPASTCKWLSQEVDQLLCLDTPHDFYAVGQFYRDFSQVTDEEVTDLLRRARTRSQDPQHPASPEQP